MTLAPGPDRDALVTAGARNLGAWHQSSLDALGWAASFGDRWWTGVLPSPTIYHSAIALAPAPRRRSSRRHLRELRALFANDAALYHSVCDPWNQLDLEPFGLTRHAVSPWFARPAGTVEPGGAGDERDVSIDDLSITAVTERSELLLFEQTMARAFEVPVLIPPFGVHAPPILDDPSMHVFLGRLDGDPVVVAMACRAAGVLGIYGVGTVTEHRGRGLATRMMRHLLTIDASLPTTLQPSRMAESMYRKLGFEPIGDFAHWT